MQNIVWSFSYDIGFDISPLCVCCYSNISILLRYKNLIIIRFLVTQQAGNIYLIKLRVDQGNVSPVFRVNTKIWCFRGHAGLNHVSCLLLNIYWSTDWWRTPWTMNLLAFYRESIKALFIRTREVGYYFAVNCENYIFENQENICESGDLGVSQQCVCSKLNIKMTPPRANGNKTQSWLFLVVIL